MKTPFYFAAVVVLALTTSSARPDGLIYQLPKDGTWVSYDMDATVEMGEHKETMKGSLRLASVGKTTEQDKPCRWIEVAFEARAGNQRQMPKITVKALIPEEHLGKGKAPLDHVIRAWIRRAESDPKELEDPKNFDKGPLPMVLAPPSKDAKQLEEKTVDSDLGELSCPGVTGTTKFKARETIDVTLETRLHPKSPFGVVAARWDINVSTEGETQPALTMNLKLSGRGDDAKSELPEQQ
ncbi:MAG: hypothetical protein HQ567_15910 [Candidatus Nealsonbacteria bacterium]|nr:hypothetical protein [Candidatus Nealsonbacteria bacterium]